MEQLTVYVLQRHVVYEFDEILGVFGSLELAEKELSAALDLPKAYTEQLDDGSKLYRRNVLGGFHQGDYWSITPYKVQLS